MRTGEYGKVPIDPERPWPGLLSFPEAAARLFHGRAREVTELLRLIESEPVAFLYGKSGLGKTSLLQAGLFPKLREQDRLPIYLRLSHGADAPSPRAQLFGAITMAMDAAQVDGPRPTADDTVWGYLHRRGTEWWSPRNRPVRPVIVLDQFEEVFTLGQASTASRERSEEFVEALQELTTARPGATQRAQFDARPDLVDAYDYDAARYAVLFSFREDFLPQFDQLRERLRINPHNRLALERLGGEGAYESVRGTGGTLVEPEVAEAIVRFVAGSPLQTSPSLGTLEVEPWLLCLVCEQLNERRLQRQPAPALISVDLLVGSRDEILSQYYSRCIAGLDPRVPAFLEDRLLTEGGYRNPYPYEEATRLDGITPAVIDELVDRRLVRREQHMGTSRLEITHDVLGPVMLRYRQQRAGQERDAIARLRQLAERRKAADGRRRSGQLVVAATVIVTLFAVITLLRTREAERARTLLAWGQETQQHAYEALLQAVRQRPVNRAVRESVHGLLSSTVEVRRTFPRDPRMMSLELQYAYLNGRAIGDSGITKEAAARVLVLADSLAALPDVGTVPALAEFSYRLAAITARERGQTGIERFNLQRQADLVDARGIPDFNLENAAAAALELSRAKQDPEAKRVLLEQALTGLERLEDWTPDGRTVDSLVAQTQALADASRAVAASDSATVRARHLLVVRAHFIRLSSAQAGAARDRNNTVARRALVSALGNLAWWTLLLGDFPASVGYATQALKLDPTQNWIEQNRHHALVFLGRLDSIAPDIRRMYNQPLTTGAGRYADVAVQDIVVMRQARLTHPDLDRYERFVRSVR